MDNELSAAYKNAGKLLRALVQEHGQDVLNTPPDLYALLLQKQCHPTVAMQIALVIEASTVRRYFSQAATGISMIDVNNIVASAESGTGLSKLAIKNTLTCIFYGLSLPTDLSTVYIPTGENGHEPKVTVTADLYQYSTALQQITKAIETNDEKLLMGYRNDFSAMCQAGHPKALYLQGLCYYRGIGTEQNITKAGQYLRAAHAGGELAATSLLGDLLFEDPSCYDEAYSYYTVIGATALSKERQKNLKVILAQHRLNLYDMAFAVVMWALALVFNILLGTGAFSVDGASHWVWAGISIGVSTLVAALAGVYFALTKYNSIKWAIPAIAVVTMLFAVLAL